MSKYGLVCGVSRVNVEALGLPWPLLNQTSILLRGDLAIYVSFMCISHSPASFLSQTKLGYKYSHFSEMKVSSFQGMLLNDIWFYWYTIPSYNYVNFCFQCRVVASLQHLLPQQVPFQNPETSRRDRRQKPTSLINQMSHRLQLPGVSRYPAETRVFTVRSQDQGTSQNLLSMLNSRRLS